MLKQIKTFLLTSAASVLTLVAMTGVSTKSMWLLYEPDAPKSLKKNF
ncbi:cyclic lactone autoinducer peptide [Caminicella sporogenes DSM 14501]|uniref:Cyclic lactone autoinducer peptide n=1 Tax=Caminicella sporogenes DSM 14501 TaxID=1121266 RepID=A0A1M6QK14_9FIRM|nr:cyclic lactone autoinducer peptide [Caminicella sporogenes]WIF95282.1 cyclic lactone autoinducer peptide [Caminicella sporogenes]SHK20556.1 cyclic lactone autoinducer peptide [Caminicella sporogenes DSM 14501]